MDPDGASAMSEDDIACDEQVESGSEAKKPCRAKRTELSNSARKEIRNLEKAYA